MSRRSASAAEFIQLAEVMAAAPDEDTRLRAAVAFAVAVVGAGTHAGIAVRDRDGRLVTQASSSEMVRRADTLQQQLGQGPSLDVDGDQEILVVADLSQELRWPAWAPRVHAELGVRSLTTLLMSQTRRSTTALTLYAEQKNGFDLEDVALARALARQIAVSVSTGQQLEDLRVAMKNRLTIGQAQGIVMERLQVTADQAFEYLRRVSSHSNRKIIDIAGDIAANRELPDLKP